jgi:hypothetical protein
MILLYFSPLCLCPVDKRNARFFWLSIFVCLLHNVFIVVFNDNSNFFFLNLFVTVLGKDTRVVLFYMCICTYYFAMETRCTTVFAPDAQVYLTNMLALRRILRRGQHFCKKISLSLM